MKIKKTQISKIGCHLKVKERGSECSKSKQSKPGNNYHWEQGQNASWQTNKHLITKQEVSKKSVFVALG